MNWKKILWTILRVLSLMYLPPLEETENAPSLKPNASADASDTSGLSC